MNRVVSKSALIVQELYSVHRPATEYISCTGLSPVLTLLYRRLSTAIFHVRGELQQHMIYHVQGCIQYKPHGRGQLHDDIFCSGLRPAVPPMYRPWSRSAT